MVHCKPLIVYNASMTTFQIKIIAIVTMVIDHIGFFFFPQMFLLRAIGRISLPLFAWLIANGAYHTHDINAYARRIFIFAVLSQVPFFLANTFVTSSVLVLNVLFTLFIGLVAIKYIKKTSDKKLWIFITLICGLAGNFFQTDYGWFGVASIVSFYIFFTNKKYLILSQVGVFALSIFIQIWVNFFTHTLFPFSITTIFYELPGLFSLFFILLYNQKEGIKVKYFFYIFYPVQYVLFFLIKLAEFYHL